MNPVGRTAPTQRMQILQSVQRQSHQRLYPTLTDPSWLILRRRREIFRRWIAALDGSAFVVLDLGGRLQPYRPLLERRVHRYVAMDIAESPLVDVVARGEQIPLANEQVDLVICTQVLQYLPEPAAVVAEIYRVLKPGGSVLLSVPTICLRDAGLDQEYWRFFPAAQRRLLGAFSEVEIAGEGSSVVGFFRTCNAWVHMFTRYPVLRLLRWVLCPVINLTGECLEWMVGSRNDQFTVNYSVRARK